MRAFYDTEFGQHNKESTLIFASIGIVREDGRELYMISSECNGNRGGSWFRRNIWPTLKDQPIKHTIAEIALAVQEFLIPVNEVVTRSGHTDKIILENLVGPLWFNHLDVDPIWQRRGRPRLPPRENKHHALADAKFYRIICETLAL